jgi:hypothetical protein
MPINALNKIRLTPLTNFCLIRLQNDAVKHGKLRKEKWNQSKKGKGKDSL